MKMNSCSAFKEMEAATSLLLQENCGFKYQFRVFLSGVCLFFSYLCGVSPISSHSQKHEH